MLYFALFHIVFWFHFLIPFIWAITRPYSLKLDFTYFRGSPIFKGPEKYTRGVEKIGTHFFVCLWTLKGHKNKILGNWFLYYGMFFQIILGLNSDNRTYRNSLNILSIIWKFIKYWTMVLQIKTITTSEIEDQAESKYIIRKEF